MPNDKMVPVPEPLYRLMLQANAIVRTKLAVGSVRDENLEEYKRLSAEYDTWYKKLYANREEGV